MRPRFIFWTLGLVAVLLTASCAPAAPSVPTEASVPATAAPADPPTEPQAAIVDPAQPPADVQAVATSRGPNLEATDPATVSLASGQLQLIEFFRFT